MLQDQVIAEIKQIPLEKLIEVYNLIHYFKLSLNYKKNTQPDSNSLTFSQRWQGKFNITTEINDERLDYLTQRYQL